MLANVHGNDWGVTLAGSGGRPAASSCLFARAWEPQAPLRLSALVTAEAIVLEVSADETAATGGCG